MHTMGFIRTSNLRFCPDAHQWALGSHNPVSSSLIVLPWTTFGRYRLLHTGTPYKTCSLSLSLSSSDQAITIYPLVKADQMPWGSIEWIRSLCLPFCFQHISFNNWLFTCCMASPSLWWCHCNEIITVHFICLWFSDWGWSVWNMSPQHL